MGVALDLRGQRFGRLTVIAEVERVRVRGVRWLCKCDCGTDVTRFTGELRSWSLSCGCIRLAENRPGKHPNATHEGQRKHPAEYSTWKSMRTRCNNPASKFYCYYGARGIEVCARWNASFEAFLADMGERPSPAHSIDRIDNDKGYEPGNCRWATQEEQSLNRSDTRRITAFGRTQPLLLWAKETGLMPETIWARVTKHGWSAEKALTTPRMNRGRAAKVGNAAYVHRKVYELERTS